MTRLRPLWTTLGASLLALPAGGELPSGEEIARRINERPRAAHASRDVTLELVREGRSPRVRRLRSFWKLDGEAKRIVLFAAAPPEIRHYAFLSIDWTDRRDDDQFFYKVERKRAERIPLTRRGEAFLGSEFTFEDVKKEDRVELHEYDWKTLGKGELDGKAVLLLEQVPATPELARSLGTSRQVNYVDPDIWLRRKIEFYDAGGALLKTFWMREVRQIEGFWTSVLIEALHASGHRSVLRIENVDYETPVPDELFTPRALQRERIP